MNLDTLLTHSAMLILGFSLGGLWALRQTDEALKIARDSLDLYRNLEVAVRALRPKPPPDGLD